jgi:Spy/CpxP family protein refolding chaperone
MEMKWHSMKGMVILGVLATELLVGQGVRAESGDNGRPGVPHEGKAGAEMVPPPPEELLGHMARQFGLTNDQQAKIMAIFTADREKSAPLMRKMAEHRQQLLAAVLAATFDEVAIRAIAAKQAQTDIELTVSRAWVQSQVNAVLSPEQRSLVAKLPPPFPCGQEADPSVNREWRRGHNPPPPCDDERPHGPGPGDCGEMR